MAVIPYVTLSADGNSSALTIGGRYIVTVFGTFGSGTCKIQYSPDDGTTWIDCVDFLTGTALSFTANGNAQIALGIGSQVRANLAGATGPTLKIAFGQI